MRSEHHDSDRREDLDHVFSDDQLWEELEHPDPSRRASALELVDALADLAGLRARHHGTGFLIERHRIFKVRSIIKEMRSDDVLLAEAASRVFTVAMMVNAVIDAEALPTTDEIRASARNLFEGVRKRLAELDAAAAKHRGAGKP